MGSIILSEGRKIEFEKFGAVHCKKYIGEFENKSLKTKAELRLWYSVVCGNPHAIEGEGETPVLAIEDSISRTESRIKEMEQAVQAMKKALKSSKTGAKSW